MQYIDGFKNELLRQGKSINTVNSYISDLCNEETGFIKWFDDTYGIEFEGQIIEQDARQYKSFLLNTKKLGVASVNRKVNAVKKFNEYLTVLGRSKSIDIKPVKVADTQDKEIKVLSKNEMNKLERAFHAKGNKRDIAIFEILANCALRVSELINLELDDIVITERNGKNNYSYIIIREGKGGKYREIILNSKAKDAIEEYFKVRALSISNKLLLGQRGELRRETINKIIEKYCNIAQIDVVNPHSIRHTVLSTMVKKGIDLVTVSRLAGHSNTKVTADFYINTSREDKQRAVNILEQD